MTENRLPVKLFLVLGVAAKGSFSLLNAMLTGCAAHQPISIHTRFDFLAFHSYNVTQKTPFVKGQCGTPRRICAPPRMSRKKNNAPEGARVSVF
jgi:hypothetical protein